MKTSRTLVPYHLFLLAVPFGLWPADSPAKEWIVNPAGTGDAATIQLAIDAAAPLDTISLAAGTYAEHLLVSGKGLTILGREGSGRTILDGEYAGRILTIRESGLAVTLDGLTFYRGIRNVPEGPGGAIAAFRSSLILKNCTFRDNLALGLGGAIFVTEDPAILEVGTPLQQVGLIIFNTVFDSNWSGIDGGAIYSSDWGMQLVECTFMNNQAVQGAGVGLLHGVHLIRDCRFESNRAKISGGGIFLSGFSSTVVEGTTFVENAGGNLGGAVRAVNAIQVILRDCQILGNTAGRGGGCYIERTEIDAERTLWRGNSATDRGGGLWIDESSGNRFLRCTWIENSSPHGASITIRSGTMSVEQSILGDPQAEATECLNRSTVEASCNVGSPTTGDCFAFESRMEIRGCESSTTSLCTVPSTTCGPAGHTDELCPPGSCVTPTLPITWGNLKSRYRQVIVRR